MRGDIVFDWLSQFLHDRVYYSRFNFLTFLVFDRSSKARFFWYLNAYFLRRLLWCMKFGQLLADCPHGSEELTIFR